jgi:methylenetetrahydrofolate reductase (NADPH)
MVKIGEKIANASNQSQPFFSFEFFPPKTDAGVENLYLRMDRMASLQPIFVDITWGAGGITKDLTMAISEYSQTYFGVDVLMHLTCTNMTVDELRQVLNAAKRVGIQNILALRGDPPKGSASWQPTSGGCNHAVDLVRLIRKEHGDYFGIAVAGFPEGHPNSAVDLDTEVVHLKEKIDAGADFVLTQFFYDPQVFLDFLAKCRSAGINCPILPGTKLHYMLSRVAIIIS